MSTPSYNIESTSMTTKWITLKPTKITLTNRRGVAPLYLRCWASRKAYHYECLTSSMNHVLHLVQSLNWVVCYMMLDTFEIEWLSFLYTPHRSWITTIIWQSSSGRGSCPNTCFHVDSFSDANYLFLQSTLL